MATIHSAIDVSGELLPLACPNAGELDDHSNVCIANQHNQQAPVSKLSDDILALIFEEGPKEKHFRDVLWRNKGKLSVPFAVRISHVSARWRFVALHDPFLWTTVTIKDGPPSPSPGLHDLFLTRSNYCPLDIRLLCYQQGSTSFNPSKLHFDRCQELTITFQSFKMASSVLPRLRDAAMPILTSLAIDCSDIRDDSSQNDYIPDGWSLSTELFHDCAPRIGQLRLEGISMGRSMLPRTSLDHLSKIYLRATRWDTQITYDEFAGALSLTANTLRDLVLEGMVVSLPDLGPGGWTGTVIYLPVLQSLEIGFPDYTDSPATLGYVEKLSTCLKVGSLKSLALANLDESDFSHAMKISSSHREIDGTGIDSLSLDLVDIGENTQLLMSHCPGIKDLSLGSRSTLFNVLQFILECDRKTIGSGDNPFCSHLRYIELTTYAPLKSRQLLDAVVKSRADIGHPITMKYKCVGLGSTQSYRS